ncbi:MAG: hypothetical protein Q7R47_02200, partial [Candidatus Diapherotrites archaeon]|nr:hypothetical protein [Candidatus Diapherotrites archaeon]
GPVALADVTFAKAIRVDRRSLRRFARKILRSPELRLVYCNIEKAVSPMLLKSDENGLIRLWALAKKPGIIANVARLLLDEKIVILQLVADDPLSVRKPKLVIVTDQKISPALAKRLAHLPNVKKVRCV